MNAADLQTLKEQAAAEVPLAAEEWSYSTNEEDYQEQESSREAILRHAINELGEDYAGSFWIGRNKRFTGRGDAETVIDQLRDQAYDECGEYSETYLEDVTAEEFKELEDFISAWATRVDRSNFWTVIDVEHHTIESARAAITKATGGREMNLQEVRPLLFDAYGYPAFLVKIGPDTEYRMDFEVFEVTSWECDKSKTPSDVELYVKGHIKWDGCSHVWFGTEEDQNGYLHLCGKECWRKHSEMMSALYALAGRTIKNTANN